MKFGSHVSIAGGVFNAPANSKKVGGEIFQIFSRSPRGGEALKLTVGIVKKFRSEMKRNNQRTAYIHTPYYINFASTNQRIVNGSIEVVRQELERASRLGALAVMTHLGSANNLPRGQALNKTIKGLNKMLKGYSGSALFLIENAAGSGNIIGNSFEEIELIIKSLSPTLSKKIGVCLDTCHAFTSGYDLRTKKTVNEIFKKFDKTIGLSKLKLNHANDSKKPLGSRKDRHEHIGQGKIGQAGFKALVNHPKLKKIDMILETPIDEHGDHATDLTILKRLVKITQK